MLPFRDHGPTDAQPLFLLLHFFGGSHREWDGVVALLQDRHRLIAADMAGFGEAASLEGFSVDAMCSRIRGILSYLAPAPVILVSHSMTGKAAMVVAAQPPSNLVGLVLVAPSPLAGEPMDDAARAEMRIANTTRARAEQFTRNGFAHAPSAEIFEIAVEDVLRSSDAAFHAWPDDGTREDWSGRVTSLQVKALLVVGEKDKAIDPELQRSQTLPLVAATGGRMHLLPDTAHLIPYEQPEQLANILEEFAREV
ncbi:alpha/beta fold hydrolase [Terriglobus aquaticus]|uniref:Alpha/beta fold hydrolase n=1 Tax=Terriglobus aquaticus TaxID=940139 RepID=A0ABW9KLI4_9BACT|nr:alpha/beta fold hydrolase [Terriglobus aquaticus]